MSKEKEIKELEEIIGNLVLFEYEANDPDDEENRRPVTIKDYCLYGTEKELAITIHSKLKDMGYIKLKEGQFIGGNKE